MKKVFSILLILIISIAAISGYFLLGNVEQTQYDFSAGEVYLPNFISIYCGRLSSQLDESLIIDNREESVCGSGNADGYVPYGCTYTNRNLRYSIGYEVVDSSKSCSDFSAFHTFRKLDANSGIKVSYGDKICFDEDIIGGTAKVEITGDKYGLTINNANGQVLFTKNCDLKSNINVLADVDYLPGISDSPRLLSPNDDVDHYINGYSAVVNSRDVVDLDGKNIYITGIGKYNPIETSADGFKFANSLSSLSDSRIICVPSQNPLCEKGLKISEVEDQECSMFSKPEGYATVRDGVECSYICGTDNKLKVDDCRAIVTCSGEKSYRNPITNVCESSVPPVISGGSCSWYQDSYTRDINVWKWYNYATLGAIRPSTEPESGCKTSGWVYLLVLAVLVLIIISLILFIPRKIIRGQK